MKHLRIYACISILLLVSGCCVSWFGSSNCCPLPPTNEELQNELDLIDEQYDDHAQAIVDNMNYQLAEAQMERQNQLHDIEVQLAQGFISDEEAEEARQEAQDDYDNTVNYWTTTADLGLGSLEISKAFDKQDARENWQQRVDEQENCARSAHGTDIHVGPAPSAAPAVTNLTDSDGKTMIGVGSTSNPNGYNLP